MDKFATFTPHYVYTANGAIRLPAVKQARLNWLEKLIQWIRS